MVAIILIYGAESKVLSFIGSGIDVYSGLLLSFCLPVKPRKFTKQERASFSLSNELKQILVGLTLGDLNVQKPSINSNVRLRFQQGSVHEEYIFYLYELFKSYCLSAPKFYSQKPDTRTGEIYTKISFNTLSLPCFNTIYNLFYLDGKKMMPSNIFDLLTPLGLAYFLCDDGSFCKKDSSIVLCTESFSLREVQLLQEVLENKFKIKCALNARGNGFRVRIPKKGLPVVQALLKDIMPPMMKYKIGL
jgi:hypothetical protein